MHHLIATTTVLPTLKSARRFCDRVRAPSIIVSGTPEECYEHAMDRLGGRGWSPNSLEVSLNGPAVFQTGDWTYHIVEDKA